MMGESFESFVTVYSPTFELQFTNEDKSVSIVKARLVHDESLGYRLMDLEYKGYISDKASCIICLSNI